MKVSLITATYNSSSTLEDALNSVATQSYTNIEHLIIDGKSTDGTALLVADHRMENPRIVFHSEQDRGIYDALNKGINRASGDIVGFVHSDDLLANPDVIKDIVHLFESGNDGVYGNLLYVDKEDTQKTVRYWESRHFNNNLLSRGWMPAHPTLFLRKEVYQKHGNFDLSFKISADYEFMLRVLRDNSLKLEFLPKVITKMRVGGASNKSIKNIIAKSMEDLRAMRRHHFKYPIYALLLKNISKIPQFLRAKLS